MIRHIVTPGLDIAVAGKLNEIVEPRVFDEVLSSARTGDVAALGEMYRFYQPSLVRYLRANAPDAADDLASETWLDVAGGLERFTGGEPDFRRWLFTIARRRLLDDRRRIIRRRQKRLGLDPERHAKQRRQRKQTGGQPCQSRVRANHSVSRRQFARLPYGEATLSIQRRSGSLAFEQIAENG